MKQLIKGIARPLLWFAAWIMAGLIVFRLLRPFLGPWTELASELGVRLPIAAITSRYLRRKQGTGKTVLKKKATAGILIAYILLACIPTQLLFQAAKAASYVGSGSNAATKVIGILLLAPVMEELAFRGVIFAMARQRLGFCPAAIFNAIVFQSVHNIGQLPVTVPLALASAALYDATGNIGYSMMLHFAFHRPEGRDHQGLPHRRHR